MSEWVPSALTSRLSPALKLDNCDTIETTCDAMRAAEVMLSDVMFRATAGWISRRWQHGHARDKELDTGVATIHVSNCGPAVCTAHCIRLLVSIPSVGASDCQQSLPILALLRYRVAGKHETGSVVRAPPPSTPIYHCDHGLVRIFRLTSMQGAAVTPQSAHRARWPVDGRHQGERPHGSGETGAGLGLR